MVSSRGSAAPASRGVLLVVISAVAFGSLGVFGKLGERDGLALPSFLSLRFGVAACVLLVVIVARGELRIPARGTVLRVGVMGVLYAGQALCYFGSLRTVPAAVTSILLYTYPVIVTLVARLLFGERLSLARLGVLLGACVGVLLVIDPFGVRTLDGAGVALGFGSALVYSIYILYGTIVMRSVAPLHATAGIAAVASVVLLVAGAATGGLRGVTGSGWLVVLGTALIPTVLAATAFLAGLRVVGPTVASALSTLEPVSTAVLAMLVLGETLSALRWLGGGLTLVAAGLLAASTAAVGRARGDVAPLEA